MYRILLLLLLTIIIMKPILPRNILLILSILSGLFISAYSYGLSTDRDQPAEIEADDIEFDFKKGTRTYIKNVLVIQGTLRLKADKLQAIYNNDELETATAWGSLARFKQRPDGKQHDVEGWAKKIIVDQKQNTLTLIGKAALKQGPDTARGETIVYNMANDTLRIKGAAKLGNAGKSGKKPPKRKLEDPFKDAPQGPTDGTQDAEKTGNQPVPTRSGRSRLIITPRSKTDDKKAVKED